MIDIEKVALKLFGPLLRWSENPNDTKDDRLRKAILIPVTCSVTVHGAIFVIVYANMGVVTGVAVSLCFFIAAVALLAYISVTKTCPQHVAGLYAAFSATPTILSDLWTYGLVDYYTSAVVAMDMLLLCNCHRYFAVYVVLFTMCVMFISWVEQCYGAFGLYDAIPESWSGLTRPPRKDNKIAINLLLHRYFIFLADYAMTRYFSKGMRDQRERVEQTVVIAQQIAKALARFDLESADEMVRQSEGLPVDLLDAFRCLLGNLRSYKPYLPLSCLPSEVERTSSESESDEEVEEEEEDEDEDRANAGTHSASTSSSTKTTSTDFATLRKRAVTLVQVNIHGFLKVAGRMEESTLLGYHAEYITHVLEATRFSRGLVEFFNCDRVLVSFNAARRCTSHRMHALGCVVRLQSSPLVAQTRLSLAVTSGDVLTGPLGCEGLRSYSLVGVTASWSPLLERVALRLSVGAITDSSVQSSASETCFFRLLGEAQYEKHDRRVLLYEFMGMKETAVAEWMYQLMEADPWELYNCALLKLRSGDPYAARRVAANLIGDTKHHAWLQREIDSALTSNSRSAMYWKIRDVELLEELVG